MFTDQVEPSSSTVSSPDPPLRTFTVKLATGVISAALLAVFETQIKGSWGPWVRTLSPWFIAAILMYLIVTTVGTLLPRWLAKRRLNRLEAETRGPLLASASMLTEATSPSFVKSVGNILNSLHDTNALDPRACNDYHIHLGTLGSMVRYLVADVRAKRIPAVEAVQRLSDMHRDYVRLNCEVSTAVNMAERSDIRISWDDIRDHTNMISNRLTELATLLREGQNEMIAHPYFQNVPRA